MNKINSNLIQTTDILHRSLIKLSERGLKMNELEEKSDMLLESSNQFISFFDPWYIRIGKTCCRPWWFRWDREEDEPRTLPMVVI